MGNREQIADLPERTEVVRARAGIPSTLESRFPVADPQSEGDETTTASGPFLTALLRALSAWAT